MILTFPKAAWREETLQFLKAIRPLWGQGKLRYSILEMVGISGTESFASLQGHLHAPTQFIGVDSDPKVILQHRLDTVPFETVFGDAYATALRMLGQPRPQPLAIYNFDTTNIAGTGWWGKLGMVLQQIVRETHLANNIVAVTLNHALDRGDTPSAELIRQQAKEFETYLGPWGASAAKILGKDVPERVEERGFLGQIGAIEVYRCRQLRMATIRFAVERGRLTLYQSKV